MRRCPFPGKSKTDEYKDPATSTLVCGAKLTYRGLIVSDFSEEGNELFRWDCPNGHTILGEFTDLMGDEEQD